MQCIGIYLTHPVAVGVGVRVVHPKRPKIEHEVVGVALQLAVSDVVGVGLQPIPRTSSQDVVGEGEGDWLSGVLDGSEQPIPRPRSPLQEAVGVGVGESDGWLDGVGEGVGDGVGHPRTNPRSPSQDVVVGEGAGEAEPVFVGEGAADVGVLLGQPVIIPRSPHADVGVALGVGAPLVGVGDAGVLDAEGEQPRSPPRSPHELVGVALGVGAPLVGVLADEGGHPIPRPNKPSHEDVGVGVDDGDCGGGGVVVPCVVCVGEVLDEGQPRIPRPSKPSHEGEEDGGVVAGCVVCASDVVCVGVGVGVVGMQPRTASNIPSHDVVGAGGVVVGVVGDVWVDEGGRTDEVEGEGSPRRPVRELMIPGWVHVDGK